MYPVRYIHAADLHLDAAFKGLARESGTQSSELADLLQQATFTAMKRLFSLCEKERPDFLVIAGDIYNQEDRSLRAQLRLRDACEALAPFGVQVFLAHGNHDPLSSRLNTLHWPDNVTVFGNSPEAWPVQREGETLALVHGISHESAKENRNLARSFSRTPLPCFQLGVLHCTLEGSKAERYAPCTLDDLRATGLDAWALGHVHERGIFSEQDPFVLYSGNSQGLHIGEDGERGCMLVQAQPSGQGFRCSASFRPLAPVLWETRDISLDGFKNMDELDTRLQNAFDKLAAEAPVNCQAILTRLRLSGRSTLDSVLRNPHDLADLAERLKEHNSLPPVWLKDFDVQTRPEFESDKVRERDDLLGEVLRLGHRASASPQAVRELAEPALQSLFASAKIRKLLPPLSDEDYLTLLADAERLSVDLLEPK